MKAGANVDFFISIAARDSGSKAKERSLLFKSLDENNLTAHLATFEQYSTYESSSLRWTSKFLHLIKAHNNTIDNSPEPLMLQYFMRHRLNQLLLSALSRDRQYKFVMFARSDIAFGNNIWDDLVNDRFLKDILGDTAHQEKLVWLPKFENYDGKNDRFMIMTFASFAGYAEAFEEKLHDYIVSGKDIHGEEIHGYMLTKFTKSDLILSTPMCYGVARISCGWTEYGDAECLSRGLPPLRQTWNITYNKNVVCGQKLNKPPSLPHFWDYVQSIQRNCSLPVAFIQGWPHGLGSMLNVGMMYAVHAWISGRRIAFVPDTEQDEAIAYFDLNICDSINKKNIMACYFQPLSECDDTNKYKFQTLSPWLSVGPVMKTAMLKQSKFQERACTPRFWSEVFHFMYKPASMMAMALNAQTRSYIPIDRVQPRNSSFICVVMSGREMTQESRVIPPSDYAIKVFGVIHPNENIFLISDDDDRTFDFKNNVVNFSLSNVVYTISNPIARLDSRQFLHVPQLMASLFYCANARIIIATLSSNLAKILLFMSLKKLPDRENVESILISLDDTATAPFFPS